MKLKYGKRVCFDKKNQKRIRQSILFKAHRIILELREFYVHQDFLKGKGSIVWFVVIGLCIVVLTYFMADLIDQFYHETYNHANDELTLNEIQNYNIPDENGQQ